MDKMNKMEYLLKFAIKYGTAFGCSLLAMLYDVRWPIFVVFVFVVVDCISAYRLSQRVKTLYPDKVAFNGGKFQSEKATSKFVRFVIYSGAILIAQILDEKVMVMWEGIYLANFTTIFAVVIEIISITENWSSCNDAPIAKLIQTVVADKTKRHLDIDITPLFNNDEKKI